MRIIHAASPLFGESHFRTPPVELRFSMIYYPDKQTGIAWVGNKITETGQTMLREGVADL